MRKAIYPGTFDPITNGHVDLIARSSVMFEEVVVGVAHSTSKSTLFTTDERIALAKEALKHLSNVKIYPFHGLMVEFAKHHNAEIVIRGLRAVSDFDYEFQLAGMNRKMAPEIETVFLTPAEHLACISSTLVRQIAKYDGPIEQFVPENVIPKLREKFDEE